MKTTVFGWVLFVVLGVSSVLVNAKEARAGYHPERGYRYHTTYHHWDRGLYGYYGYSERVCRYTSNGYRTYYSCYEIQPSTTVYIEERHMSGGYKKVTVYRDWTYTGVPYAEYYVYDDGIVRRVEYRRVYSNPYVADEYYYSEHYHVHRHVWVHELDWNNGFDKVMIGSYFVVIGANVLQHATTDFELALGLASMGAGSFSISLGIDQLEQESELSHYMKTHAHDGDSARDIR